ncbi:hypothetical protein MLD38_009945 [Melastoma candidum]|uniref:Uncharacterized protein n=1 Tax=Melastoma candidum TaxID=119954 RepID=A0ACB9R6K8_9MYRT|nr:hypothetical protein MLD38_009945 [Melastoma candidum]
MLRFPENDRLLITLAVFLVVYAQTFQASAAVKGRLFHGLSREDVAEMAGYGEEKLSTVLVTGSVVCEGYLRGRSLLHAWPVSGARVAVECRGEGRRGTSIQTKGITDEDGDFTIDLPSHLHGIVDLQGKCCVRLLQKPRSLPCQPAGLRKHVPIRLSSVTGGTRTYEARKIKLIRSSSQLAQTHIRQRKGDVIGLW